MSSNLITIIFSMAVATYLTKGSLMFFHQQGRIPEIINRWLGYIPLAIMTALVAPIFFVQNGQFVGGICNPYLWAGMVASGIAYWRENLLLTMIGGIVSLLIFRVLF